MTAGEGAGRAPTSAASRLGRAAMGERLGGFIYGTIVALSVIVAGARAYPRSPGHVAVLVGVTCLVFWIAHVYANAISHGIVHDEHLSFRELRRIARREASLVEAAVPLIAALLLGSVGILGARASVWLAFAIGLAILGAEGLIFARAERLGWLGAAGVVAANLGLGVLLVALKLVITH